DRTDFCFQELGGSVWESNPPSTPRRDGSPALKTGRITGPLAPPRLHKRMLSRRLTHNCNARGTSLIVAVPVLVSAGVTRCKLACHLYSVWVGCHTASCCRRARKQMVIEQPQRLSMRLRIADLVESMGHSHPLILRRRF